MNPSRCRQEGHSRNMPFTVLMSLHKHYMALDDNGVTQQSESCGPEHNPDEILAFNVQLLNDFLGWKRPSIADELCRSREN